MKQLSLFLVFIICLNTIDLISSNRYREYEAPRIIHNSTPQEQEQKQINKDMDILNQEDTLFSAEKILKWIEEVNKKDIGKMKKEEIHHSLEGIKRASSQIQSYLKRISAQIEASINTIDLKVNEISIVDEKISQLKPAYKKELDKISKKSGSLLNALKKEKTAVDKVLKKLRKETTNTNLISSKSDDVEKKIDLLDLSKNVKERINEKLVSFMTVKNFEKAHKNFMVVVEKEMEKNFEAYKQYSDEKIAADLIVKNWSDMLKQVEREEKVIVESINTAEKIQNTDAMGKDSEEKDSDIDIPEIPDDIEENAIETDKETEKEKEKEKEKNKPILNKNKSNRKNHKEEKEKEKEKAIEKEDKNMDKNEDKEDEDNEDEEDSEDNEEEENLKDSESEFDQEYFNKEKDDTPASFLEKISKNKKTFNDNIDE